MEPSIFTFCRPKNFSESAIPQRHTHDAFIKEFSWLGGVRARVIRWVQFAAFPPLTSDRRFRFCRRKIALRKRGCLILETRPNCFRFDALASSRECFHFWD
ncbi:hypothetical protein CEXT_341521 [Caerostris extrusa]|uniref:Uncharacterized protein n=1 Tax=Caerostris extrusa TaxID=172846 RepID=A0AAV4NHC5_CAEEX|nr:hypothetical protein CEXT_341521 [Caerostris extrusa]